LAGALTRISPRTFVELSRQPTTSKRRVLEADGRRAPLQEEVRRQDLWACHLGSELGGPGFGQVKLSLLNEILGRTEPGPTVGPILFGCAAPTATTPRSSAANTS
jgi:alkylation response protein AidB-like acyl-CoA dehydrogenase